MDKDLKKLERKIKFIEKYLDLVRHYIAVMFAMINILARDLKPEQKAELNIIWLELNKKKNEIYDEYRKIITKR